MLGRPNRDKTSAAEPLVTLAQMAEQQNMQVDDQGPDGPLFVTHWETSFRATLDTHWAVWSRDRGVEHLQGIFSDRDAAVKFVVMTVGHGWRSLNGYPHWSGDEVPVAPGADVRRLEWPGGWAELRKGYSAGHDSAEYRLLVEASLEEVVASYGDPHGRPLFRV